MSKKIFQTTGDSWKELAESSAKIPTGPGVATSLMVRRMNEIWPFSTAQGIFDNGCGPGTIISHILEEYGTEISPSASILAGDFSDPMLDAFRRKKEAKIQTAGEVWNRVEVRNVDAHDLSSISSDSMSHVMGGMVYFLLPDPRKALKETHRVLCPGGIIATSNGKSSQHIDALNEAVERVRPGTNAALLSGVWTSEEGVKGELEATGFEDVETHLVESSISYQTHQQFAEILLKMPVLKNITEGFSEDEIRDLQHHAVEEMRNINPAEPGELRGVAIVALARKPGSYKGDER